MTFHSGENSCNQGTAWGIRWSGINFSQPEQKEGLILYSSDLWTELFIFALKDSDAAFVECFSKKLMMDQSENLRDSSIKYAF